MWCNEKLFCWKLFFNSICVLSHCCSMILWRRYSTICQTFDGWSCQNIYFASGDSMQISSCTSGYGKCISWSNIYKESLVKHDPHFRTIHNLLSRSARFWDLVCDHNQSPQQLPSQQMLSSKVTNINLLDNQYSISWSQHCGTCGWIGSCVMHTLPLWPWQVCCVCLTIFIFDTLSIKVLLVRWAFNKHDKYWNVCHTYL